MIGIGALSDEDALRRSRRLEQLGFVVTPKRLQQLHAGARPTAAETHVARLAELLPKIDSGMSPEQAVAEDIRMRRTTRAVLIALCAITFIVLLAALLSALLG